MEGGLPLTCCVSSGSGAPCRGGSRPGRRETAKPTGRPTQPTSAPRSHQNLPIWMGSQQPPSSPTRGLSPPDLPIDPPCLPLSFLGIWGLLSCGMGWAGQSCDLWMRPLPRTWRGEGVVLSFPEFCWWRADHVSSLHHTLVLSRCFPHLRSYSILTLELVLDLGLSCVTFRRR